MVTRILHLSAAALTLAACSSGFPTDAHNPNFSESPSCPTHRSPTELTQFVYYWPCGATIDLVAVGNIPASDVQRVEDEWNDSVHAQALNLPYFSNTAAGRHRVAVGGMSSDNNAGQVWPVPLSPPAQPDSIDMHAGTAGAFLPVLFTESTHILGFLNGWEKVGTAGVTTNCVGYTRAGATTYLNTSLCQYQIEYLYYAYGLRQTPPSETKHIVTGISGLSNVTLSVGETFTARVASVDFGRADPAWCGSSTCHKDPSIALFSWLGGDSAVALGTSGNATRTVTGLKAGSATILVRFAKTVPADTNDVTALFGTSFSPNSFTVTVTATPPPPSPDPSMFSFDPASCQDKVTVIRYKLTWRRGTGATYEIREGTVNDVSQATLMSSGPSSTTSALTSYYSKTSPPLQHYWWLRELSATGAPGPWLANVLNGQSAADGCVF
jgi:hypothetical protein